MIQGAFTKVFAKKCLIHALVSNCGCERKVATSYAFSNGHQIWMQPALLARKHRSSATKASGNLIANQQHIVFCTGLAKSCKLCSRPHLHSRSALHERLNNDCCKLVGVFGNERACNRDAVWVFEAGGAKYTKAKWVKNLGSKSACPNRKRTQRVSVIRATKS